MRSIWCLLPALLIPQLLAAQTDVALSGGKPDPDVPVEVTSESLTVNRDEGTALFEGDVLVVQGILRMNADEVLVLYFEDTDSGKTEIEEIIATGNVVLVNGPEAAEGDRAVYQPVAGTVEMSGDVVLIQGPSTIAGDTLVVDLETGKGTMEGRVRSVFSTAPESSDAE